ncbi:hypothetical protein JAAARDRAFT_687875, partial [Jaapia argillacea MUCL 33604]
FPPKPLEDSHIREIVRQYCDNLEPSYYEERGCKVCGRLTIGTQLTSETLLDIDWNILARPGEGVTRKERKSSSDPIEEFKGPIVASKCTEVCKYCEEELKQDKIPKFSLANGMWLGNVPEVLKNLTWAE